MKFIKKSQIAIFSVAALVLAAGYINYKYDPEREKQLGEAVFVNGKEGYIYEGNVQGEQSQKQPQQPNETIKEENKVDEKDVLAEFKLQRENMNSELIDSYNKIISNEASSKEKIAQYQEKLNDLIATKHLVSMVENIIKTNGISNVVIIPTNGNINAIIASEDEMPKEKIALVESIIKNEFKISSNKVSITVKKSESVK